MNDEFYVGYEPLMPASIARRVRAAAVVLLALAAVVSGVLALAQGRFAQATFEFGRPRVFDGLLVEFPYPALIARGASDDAASVYWLVGPGKHGAENFVKGHDGRHVTLSGMLIERDGDRMIEITSNGAMTIVGASQVPIEPLHSLGAITLAGEIVDSKCHLGVMKPGEGPTHRDCAVRCLLGQVMPMIVTTDRGGASRRIALVDRDGRPFRDPLDGVVGRPVKVRGELLARGPLRFVATSGVRVH